MNIVLDTNAFYSFFGREKLGWDIGRKVYITELRSVCLSSNHRLYITSVTIFEMIARFQKKPDILKSLLDFTTKNCEIINIGIKNIESEKINALTRLSDNLLIKKSKKYVQHKIYTEAGMASRLLLLQLLIYINMYFTRAEKISICFRNKTKDQQELIKSNLFDIVMFKSYETEIKKIDAEFIDALKRGYAKESKTGKSGIAFKNIKNKFNELLCLKYLEITAFFEYVFADDENNFEKKLLGEEFIEIMEKNNNIQALLEGKEHINYKIMELIKDFEENTSTDFINEYITRYFFKYKNTSFSDSQIEYMGKLFLKWNVNGAKYEKNDLLDMLFLSVLDKTGYILITHDEDMIRYIFQKGHISKEYIERTYDCTNL